MTRQKFEEKSFEDVMSQLNEEYDEITTLDRLKEFAKLKLDEGNYLLANHIIEALQAGHEFEKEYNMEIHDFLKFYIENVMDNS